MASRIGGALKATGLDKVLGLTAVGLVGTEAAKYALINPALERAGIKTPSYVPPPAMSQYEEVMLGRQEQPGFLGFGGQQRTQGLIEKRALQRMEMEKNAQDYAFRLAELQLKNGYNPMEAQRMYADRDKYIADRANISNISANMASSMIGSQVMSNPINYSQTGYAPMQQMQMSPSTTMQMGGFRGRGRGRSPYGVDMSAEGIPGAPITPDMREQMRYSPEQMGQFSGRGGSMARGFDSAKYGYVDNSVPMGAENYALEGGYQDPYGGYGRQGTSRRRGRG